MQTGHPSLGGHPCDGGGYLVHGKLRECADVTNNFLNVYMYLYL